MAISPPSDIVLDVARAVEPAALQAARERLQAIGRTGQAADFSAARTAADLRGSQRAGQAVRGTPESFVKFEAMVLQSFLQSMLPNDAEQVYGTGLAGDMWKSFLAQELAGQMAQRGGIGISERILGDFYLANEDRVPVAGIDGDPERRQAADKQDLLSLALVQEIQRNIVRGVSDISAGAAAGPQR